MLQTKEQEKKKTGENANEIDKNNLPDKEFKEMIIRMVNKLESRIEKFRECFKRVRKCNKKTINIQ